MSSASSQEADSVPIGVFSFTPSLADVELAADIGIDYLHPYDLVGSFVLLDPDTPEGAVVAEHGMKVMLSVKDFCWGALAEDMERDDSREHALGCDR